MVPKQIRLRAVRGPGGGSSWNLAFCGPKNVLQRLQNIKYFWKKNPINSSVFTEWRPCIMPGFSPPISLLNISVYRLQPRLFIDSLPYLKKTQKDHKELQFLSLYFFSLQKDVCASYFTNNYVFFVFSTNQQSSGKFWMEHRFYWW